MNAFSQKLDCKTGVKNTGYGFVALVGGIFIRPFEILITKNPVDKKISNNYYFNPFNDDVYYSPMGNWFELGFDKLEGVKTKDFTVLSYYLAHTKTTVYAAKYPIFGLDMANVKYPDSFGYLYDKKTVYFINGSNYEAPLKINNVDMASFEVLDALFAKTKDSLYYWGKALSGVEDFASFKHIPDHALGYDARNLYFIFDKTTVLKHPLVNPASIRAFPKINAVLCDNKFVGSLFNHTSSKYELIEVKMPSLDLSSLKFDEYKYFWDKNHVYSMHNDGFPVEIPGAHGASFVSLGQGFAKDDNQVFYDGKPMSGVENVKMFKLNKDARHNYMKWGFDGQNLYFIDYLESTDKNANKKAVFVKHKIINPNSIQFIERDYKLLMKFDNKVVDLHGKLR